MSRYNYQRRPTKSVPVGRVIIGGDAPVVIQSMTNTDTNDVEASVAQIERIYEAGAPLVRLTTQGVREASALAEITAMLRRHGCPVEISADVHFNRGAALKAAETAAKVRINPGNFADAVHTFRHLDLSDEEYRAETLKIRGPVREFIEVCRRHQTAVRIGVNHGSLSDRIMSRYGNTPLGLTESVMEYLREFSRENFDRVVVSVKSSSPSVMVESVREVAAAMDREGMNLPLHLGVTEAGAGTDGRIKSAAGIGALMLDGYGDTVRVSLSEAPEKEVPVARVLVDYVASRQGHPRIPEAPGHTDRRGNVLVKGEYPDEWKDPLVINAAEADFPDDDRRPVILVSSHQNPTGEIASAIDRNQCAGHRNPVIVRLKYSDEDTETSRIKAAADFGHLLLNGYADAIEVEITGQTPEENRALALDILQACGLRRFKTEYISCPSCGRTLFDLEETLREVKEATSHLSKLRIGVMGCVVNGPGEMAGADYGFVGAGPGRVSLYKGLEVKEKNIPREEALEKFISLIKENGDWEDPLLRTL